jgi:hypothetical protein
MELFVARAAQSAYNKAGYPKDEAFRYGQQIARYLSENLPMVRKLYHVDDEFELAFRVAQTLVAYEAGALQ